MVSVRCTGTALCRSIGFLQSPAFLMLLYSYSISGSISTNSNSVGAERREKE